MRKSLLMLAAALTLTACTSLQKPQGWTQNQVELTTAKTTQGDLMTVRLGIKPLTTDLGNVLMYVGGEGLTTEDRRCYKVGNGLGCELGNIAKGTAQEVTVSGKNLSAQVKFNVAGQPAFVLRYF